MNRPSMAVCLLAALTSPAAGSHDAHPVAAAASPPGPSFSCESVQPGSIAALICTDPELSALDRKLTQVYAEASREAAKEQPLRLKAGQRGWLKERDECWKSDDRHDCVRMEYLIRIAELQAHYRLVQARGPFRFICDGNADNEISITFFDTDPASAIAEYGDSVSVMYVQPSASGAKYQGRNETFWEHQGEATVTWGRDAPQMHCRRR